MVPTTFLLGACAVAVGASECENTLVSVVNVDSDACTVTDMAVDSDGWVFITTAPSASFRFTTLCHSVMMCSPQFVCTRLHTDSDWASPSGIAVDMSDGRTVYISELGGPGGSSPDQPTRKGVKKCRIDFREGTLLDCIQFGEHWDSPHGLALDYDGNVLVTNAHDAPLPSNPDRVKVSGTWKCTPSGQCVHLDGSGSGYFHERGVAADSKGNVFVSGFQTDGRSPNITGSIAECSPHAACHKYDTPRKISGHLGLAVDEDDHLYIRDGPNFIQCSSDGTCEDIAACHGDLPSCVMAIHNGFIYSVTRANNGGQSQLQLRRFQFPTNNFQI